MGRHDDDDLFVPGDSPPRSARSTRPVIQLFHEDELTDSDIAVDQDIDDEANTTEEIFCICQRPEDGFMICCDGCDKWFHGACVSLQESDEEHVDKFFCPDCEHESKGTTVWRGTPAQVAAHKDRVQKVQDRKDQAQRVSSVFAQWQKDPTLVRMGECLDVHERKRLYLKQLREGKLMRAGKVSVPSPKNSSPQKPPPYTRRSRGIGEVEAETDLELRPAKRSRTSTIPASTGRLVGTATVASPSAAEIQTPHYSRMIQIPLGLDKDISIGLGSEDNGGEAADANEKYDKPPSTTDILVKDAVNAALFGEPRLLDCPGKDLEMKFVNWQNL